MDLDAVEPGLLRVHRAGPELPHNIPDFPGLESTGDRDWLLPARDMDLLIHRECRGGDRQLPAKEVRVRHPPHVPELEEDLPAGTVDRFCHVHPSFSLFFRIDPRCADEPDPHGAHLRAFRDDQAGRGPLGVIGDRERAGDVCPDSTAPRHRGHDHPVGKREVAEGRGSQEAQFPGW